MASGAGNIFPLPGVGPPNPFYRPTSRSRRSVTRYRHRCRVNATANHIVSAINQLSTSFYSPKSSTFNPSAPSPIPSLVDLDSDFSFRSVPSSSTATAPQARLLNRIKDCAERFVGRLPDPVSGSGLSGDTPSVPPSSVESKLHPSSSPKLSSNSFHWLDSNPFSALAPADPNNLLPAGTYGQTFTSAAVSIVADRVALPAHAGEVAVMDVLPDSLKAYYSEPGPSLRPTPEPGSNEEKKLEQKIGKPSVFASKSEYIRLLLRMLACGMITFTTKPKVVNGLFAVEKPDKSQRLILNAVFANKVFDDPPHVALPTPELFAKLVVPPGNPKFFVAKSDLSDFFYRFAIPQWMIPYFALPPIISDEMGPQVVAEYGSGVEVFPCLRVLAMGWSHSVLVAQSIHEHLLNTETKLCAAEDRISAGADLRLLVSRVLHAVYIDDVCFIGLERHLVEAALDEYLSVFQRRLLPAKPSKVVRPSAEGVEVLGVAIHGTDHTVGVLPEKMRLLCAATSTLLLQRCATGLEIARCVGRWTWAMLVARPSLSIFNAVYRFINTAQAIPFGIWRSVRRELWTAIRLAPLMFASLSIDWFHSVVACDASLTGQGVVAAAVDRITEPVVTEAASRAGVLFKPDQRKEAELNSALLTGQRGDLTWRTIVSAPFQRAEHINQLELRSVWTSLRWVVSSPHSINRRLLLLSDSQVAVGALTKGRSSAHALLARLRPTCALLLASGIQLSVRWIKSELNPADAPSRRYYFT
jgi:hypothetical protein